LHATSALTHTKHLHALSDTESEEVRALLDSVNESSARATTGGDTPQASAPVDTTHTTLANSSLGVRAEDDIAVAMEGEIMSQGGEGGQSRMAGGGAGQHTTGASETSGAMSSGGPVTWTRTSRGTPRGRSSRSGSKEVPRYGAGRGRTNVNDPTSTPGTPAAAATQTTPQSAGCKRPGPDRP